MSTSTQNPQSPINATGNIALIPKNIPREKDLRTLLQKYKTIRLASLQSAPEAFSSTCERESQFGDEVWAARLRNPLASAFVALIPKDSGAVPIEGEDQFGSELRRLVEGDWVGSLTLLGPVVVPKGQEREHETGNEDDALWELFRAIDFSEASKAAVSADSHIVYIFAGMFVLPEERGRGYGFGLVEAAKRVVNAERREKGARKATVLALVIHGNDAARRLYERAGFRVLKESVMVEGDLTRALGWTVQ